VAHDEQLAWEERAGKPAAAAAFGAALMAIAAGAYLPVALSRNPDGDYELLRAADLESSDFVVSGVLQSLGFLLLVPVLLYLYRAARYRHPQLMPAAAVLVVLGALTLAAVTIVGQLERIDIAHSFFPEHAHGDDLDEVATDYVKDEYSAALQGISLGGSIALAFGLGMIALNAMRAGLLSRFMGVLGIFVGVLLVIPLGVQILQLFWFAALGLLFIGRWPGGRGPAWQTGEAIPWPGAGQQREELERRRAEHAGLGEPPAETDEPDQADEADEAETSRPKSRKRRKKR
jgi:hypothetical protein